MSTKGAKWNERRIIDYLSYSTSGFLLKFSVFTKSTHHLNHLTDAEPRSGPHSVDLEITNPPPWPSLQAASISRWNSESLACFRSKCPCQSQLSRSVFCSTQDYGSYARYIDTKTGFFPLINPAEETIGTWHWIDGEKQCWCRFCSRRTSLYSKRTLPSSLRPPYSTGTSNTPPTRWRAKIIQPAESRKDIHNTHDPGGENPRSTFVWSYQDVKTP